VVLGGRREEMGEALAGELGGPASFRRTDVTVESDVEALVGHAADRYGPPSSTSPAAAAVELGESGIRVNSISPGVVLTGICDYQPIRRTGTTEDVTAAALWLAGDATGLVNGHDLALDDGVSAGRAGSVSRADCVQLTTAFGRARP
jgi:NAD(P)-dependent dehydrogenase (short-subunit alcohol dehydrogenase family)